MSGEIRSFGEQESYLDLLLHEMHGDLYECMAMGERYHAVTVCNDCCAGCAGDGKEALCEALGPCRPVARADGKPCVWRLMSDALVTVEEYKPRLRWLRECEIQY